jgi:cytoskeleton protein RodZ
VFEIGSSLERAREGRGLELADVEEATRIRACYLVALEQERFDQLPDGYARAFLRSYAMYLGLDAQRLVDEHDAQFPPAPPVRARRQPRRWHQWAAPRATVFLLAGVVALLALLVAGQFNSGRRTSAPPAVSPPPPRPPVASVIRKRPQHPSRLERRPRVVLHASKGDCWIAVRLGSGGGSLLYENLLQPGESVSFVRLPLWVRVGAPGNLVLTLNGRRLGPLAGYGPLNVIVGKSGIRRV